MAVGPTEALKQVQFSVTAQQADLAIQAIQNANNAMKGTFLGVVDPNSAIAPAGTNPAVRDTGIGVMIDISA